MANKQVVVELVGQMSVQKTKAKLNKDIQTLEGQLKKLNISSDILDDKHLTKSVQSINGSLKTYKDALGNIVKVQEKVVNGQSQFNVVTEKGTASTKKAITASKELAKAGDKVHYSWKKAFVSFSMYMSVTTLFYGTIRTIGSMVEEVSNLDKSLTELQKVTDLNGSSLEEFTRQAYEAGTQLGKTGTDVIDATTEFAKAGFNNSESMTLGKVALMYTNIADEEMSAADSANFLIAQLKAFNMTASQSQHIIDAVNEVSNKYAVSSGDISQNLGKASASLASNNTTFEQSLGLLTAITEQTRNASTASNALKSISAHLMGLTDEGEKDAELIPKLRGLFRQYNVEMLNTDGTLKSTYEILTDLSKVWDGLSDEVKNNIAQTVGGIYQYNNFLALMNNFDSAVGATETALDSMGSAQAENEKYVNSIAGKMKGLNSEFEKLAYTTINSGLIKGLIDFGTSILSATNDIGGLGPVLLMIVGIITTIESKNIGNTVANIAKNISKLNVKIEEAGGFWKYLKSSMTGANATASALATTMGILTAAVSVGIMIYSSYQQKQQEMMDNAISSGDALISLGDSFKDTSSKIREYQGILQNAGSTDSDITNAKASLLDIQKQLISQYGEEAKALDLVNGTYKDQIDKIDELTKKKSQEWINANQRAIDKAKKDLEDVVKLGADYRGSLITNVGGDSWDKSKYMAGLGKEFGYDTKAETGLGTGTLYINENYEKTLEYLNQMSEYLQKNKQAVLDAGFSESDYKDMLNDTGDAISKLNEQYAKDIEITEKAKGATDILTGAQSDNADSANEASANTQYLIKTQDELDSSLKSVNDKLDEIQSAYDTLSGAINEYNEQGYLSVDTLQQLSSLGIEYLDNLFNEQGQLELNETAMRNLTVAHLEELKLQAMEKLLNYANTIGTMTDAELEQADAINKVSDALKNRNYEEAKSLAIGLLGGDQKKVDAFNSQLSTTMGTINTIDQTINKIQSGSGRVTNNDSSSSGKTWWEKQLDALKQQFDYNEITMQEYINGLSRLLSQLQRGSDEWRQVNDLMQQQKISKVEEDYKNGTTSLEQYISALKELIVTYRQGSEAWNDLSEKIKKANQELLENSKDNYDKAYSAATKLIDDEIDKIQDLKDTREKYYDDQIDSIKKLNEETEEQINLTQLQQNLINAQNEKNKRVFVAGIGWTWQADQSAINDAQKELTNAKNEKAIKDLEDARDAELKSLDDVLQGWNNYKDAWSDIQNSFEDAQNRIILAQKFGASFESDILNARLSALEKFKNAYLNIQGQIAGASGGIIPSINDYTSMANGISLNSSMPNSNSIANLLSSYTAPSIVSPSTSSGSSYTYNFENLVLPDVTNAQQFITALKSMINLTKNQ